VPDNADENALTALFAGEYAGLFGRFLPSLSRWGLPVPLGGTSNHFRIEALRAIGGWDAYNVTEDADLGVRLRRVNLRAVPFNSRTYEEAPTSLSAWMAQRTRWMKGWIQTYLVHGLDSRRLVRDIGWRAFFGFHVLVGGMILTALLHTVFAGLVVARLIAEGPAGFIPSDMWDWVNVAVLALGYGGAATLALSGLVHLRAWHLAPVQLLLPFYWLLHSIAALRAVYEFNERPFYWAKTAHGLTRKARGETLLGRTGERLPVTSRSG
jgi:glycosyltransferase XagB